MAEFKMILVKDISPDPKQPRKFFEERAMLELSASIKTNGVLQPIMVRPLGAKYMLVCGERRYKATISAGLKEIPAVIRHLSDDEALEVQITENLQRKDVHPMEEAIAFKALADKYTQTEISLRVGKSESFVVKRIKLADLVEDAQELFFSNRIEMKHATMLCRLPNEVQISILKEILPKNWKDPKSNISIWNLERLCDDQNERLDTAPFKISDAKLYPEAGACTKCPFNSANQPLLFDDLKGKNCMKPSCYQIKCTRHETKELEAIAADPNRIVILGTSYLSNEDKRIATAAKELGINILDEKLFEQLYDDEIEPGTFEEYADDQSVDMDDADELADAKEEYERHVKNCAENKQKLDEARKTGNVVDAYVLVGYEKGKTIPIQLNSAAKAMVDVASGNAGDNEILSEIARIETREARNKELDAEKVHAAVQDVFKKSEEFIAAQPKRGWNLSQTELIASALALFEAGTMAFRKWMKDAYELKGSYTITADDLKKLNGINEFAINEMLRRFMHDKLLCETASRFTIGNAAIIHQLTSDLHQSQVAGIVLAQDTKAIKRQVNVEKRIAALRKNLTPVPVEEPAAAAPTKKARAKRAAGTLE